MIRRTVIQYRGSPEATAREFQSALKGAFEEVGIFWFTKFLPGHFQPFAHDKYGYQTRSVDWQRKKLKMTGQNVDNVFTGTMRDRVLAIRRVTSTSKGGRVTLYGPQWLYAYRKDYRQPDKADEIKRVRDDEANRLARVADAFITARIKACQGVETRSLT